MPDPFCSEPIEAREGGDKHTLEDPRTACQRQYARAREYCRCTLDQLINSGHAKRYLREIWLLGCMVRKPQKAQRLPPGNPFRSSSPPVSWVEDRSSV